MSRYHTCKPKSWWMMLPSAESQRNCARLYETLGYKYIIGWRDVNGYGLYVVQFPEWTVGSIAYINLRVP